MHACLLAIACALAAACAGSHGIEADRAYEAGLAPVERLEVRSSRRPPAMVRVEAIGVLPDACTEIDRVRQQRSAAGVTVTLTTRREARAGCAAEPVPFRRGVLLDVEGLPPGLYFVEVNGVRETFEVFGGLGVRDRYERQRWP
jgi:inhibitor of cysteine peptidase